MTSRQGPLRYPPLNSLRMFESAARHLNFRIASEELGVTQGAVAQQVRGLEEELKVKLFDRLPRSLALTDAGRTYLAPVQRALKMIAEATDDLRPQKTVVTVSVTSSFATKWLIPRLGQFTDENPDLEVQVSASNSLVNFQSDGIDIAVRQTKPHFAAGLRADLMFALKLTVVCSPALMSGDHPLLTLQDLRHHVLLHDAHGLWPVFLEKAGIDAPLKSYKALKFSHESLAIDAAISGQGVALANEPLVEDDILAGRLCRPIDFTVTDEQGFYIVCPRESRKAEQVKRMRDWLLSQSHILQGKYSFGFSR
jgi:LysR family glycine cleavage system transcriptional activator